MVTGRSPHTWPKGAAGGLQADARSGSPLRGRGAAAGWPGVTAAVPAAPELRAYLAGSVDAVRIQRVADVMRNSSEPRFDVTPVLPGNP